MKKYTLTALCCNPSVDRTLETAGLVVGGTNRVCETRADAGGKGVNLAINSAALGARCRCAGFMGDIHADIFFRRLAECGVDADFIRVGGEVRSNMKILDTECGVVTELNRAGEPVSENHTRELAELVRRAARDSRWIALTGSLPPGCREDYYASLARAAKEADPSCFIAVDAEGAQLANALPYADLIKPNLHELELAANRSLGSIEEVRAAAAGLGVKTAIVSMGKCGALLLDGELILRADGVAVKVASTVGAGDCMLGAYIAEFDRHESSAEAFKLACAAAGVSVTLEGTQPVTRALVSDMLERIAISRVG